MNSKNQAYWQRIPVPTECQNGNSWERQIDQVWRLENQNSVKLYQIRFFSTKKFHNMTHICMKKVDIKKFSENPIEAAFNSEDPTYAERLEALKVCGRWKKTAVEVFPAQRNMIDGGNLYHIWEVQDEKCFPFDISMIYVLEKGNEESVTIDGMEVIYSKKVVKTPYGPECYLYLYSEKELKWNQKQRLKNVIIDEEITAVEVITDGSRNINYSCLICLPIMFKLDFGIHKI